LYEQSPEIVVQFRPLRLKFDRAAKFADCVGYLTWKKSNMRPSV